MLKDFTILGSRAFTLSTLIKTEKERRDHNLSFFGVQFFIVIWAYLLRFQYIQIIGFTITVITQIIIKC